MRLDQKDVRALVRLVGEVAALPGGHTEKKRFLMGGLCKLVKADAWMWGLSCQRDPDKPQVYVSCVQGGFSDKRFTKLLEAIEHPEMIALASNFFIELQEKKSHLTRTRHQIATPEQFASAPNAIEAWKVADVGPTILSFRPLDAISSSMMAIYRKYGRKEFIASEARIAHIVWTEVPWLHEMGWPEDRGANVPVLSRRQRLTLNLLVHGHNHKQIASNLNISPHTTQEYIKAIYRHFGIHSKAELISRFFRGDGRDLD